MIFDPVKGNFSHISLTRAFSALNVLKIACGGMRHSSLSAFSEQKNHSRCDRNLNGKTT